MKEMETVTLCGFRFTCEAVIEGVPINPVLPANFDDTPHEQRSDQSRAWWGVPFIVAQANFATTEDHRAAFRKHWGGDVRYDVRCLDGGAWDRSTAWGMFGTLEAALAYVREIVAERSSNAG